LTKKPVTVLIASTHNHEGPDTLGLWGPTPLQTGRDEKYMAWLREQIAQCVVEALGKLEPATLVLAKDSRKELADLQLDTRLPHVKDHTLCVLQAVSKKTGRTIGTLVNWANHPEVLGSKNRLLSSDFCWALYERLEDLLGGVAVFWNGAIGGLITPLGEELKVTDPVTGQPAPEASFRKAELVGQFVAEVAAEAVKSKQAVRLDKGSLRVLLYPQPCSRIRTYKPAIQPLVAEPIVQPQPKSNRKWWKVAAPAKSIGAPQSEARGKTRCKR
jgi:hypothetical protein